MQFGARFESDAAGSATVRVALSQEIPFRLENVVRVTQLAQAHAK